ncbi:MAG: hypothetical protein HGA97_10625 [Chlorobiaceae bacterium]|nr:hypothetical protein [Chlorobiaceae bacterium]
MNTEKHRINLDFFAAKHAQVVVGKDSEGKGTIVTKAIGVLQEHGVYALFLYLLAKEGAKGRVLTDEMIVLLHEVGFCHKEGNPPATISDILSHVNENISNTSLQRLIFAKELLEQMLIYIRYGEEARVTPKESGATP